MGGTSECRGLYKPRAQRAQNYFGLRTGKNIIPYLTFLPE
jgi:hypothetical protein